MHLSKVEIYWRDRVTDIIRGIRKYYNRITTRLARCFFTIYLFDSWSPLRIFIASRIQNWFEIVRSKTLKSSRWMWTSSTLINYKSTQQSSPWTFQHPLVPRNHQNITLKTTKTSKFNNILTTRSRQRLTTDFEGRRRPTTRLTILIIEI